MCLVRVPWCLSDQHGPVQLALNVRMTRAAGMDERMDGDQDEPLRVELPDLNRQLSDRGETQHGRHRHLWRGRREQVGRKTRLDKKGGNIQHMGRDRLQKRQRKIVKGYFVKWGKAGTKRRTRQGKRKRDKG